MFATPANFCATPGSVSPWAAAPAPARATVLIVEDEDNIARLLTTILERDGRRVLRARLAREAHALFDEHGGSIALVLLDCTLPDFPGGLLARQLRERAPRLPVLLVSGRDVTALRDGLAAGGPTGFVAKPFFPADVSRHVRALTGATDSCVVTAHA